MKLAQQQIAKELYMHTGRTMTDLAEQLDIDRKTLYNWAKIGGWEQLKVAARQRPAAMLQHIHNHIDEINFHIANRLDRYPTMQEVEMLRKLHAMARSTDKKNAGTYLQAFSELGAFVNGKDPALAQQINDYAGQFTIGVLKNTNLHTEELSHDIHTNFTSGPGSQYHNIPERQYPPNYQSTTGAYPETGENRGIFGENEIPCIGGNHPLETATVRLYKAIEENTEPEKFPKTNFIRNGELPPIPRESRLFSSRSAQYAITPRQQHDSYTSEFIDATIHRKKLYSNNSPYSPKEKN